MYDFLKSSLNLPYRINLSNLTEVRHTNGSIKHIRRVQQAPYPLTKVPQDIEPYGILDVVERTTNINVQNNSTMSSINIKPVPQIPTPSKSKKLFPNLVKLKHQPATNESNSMPSTSTASTSTKFARHIFNNLNIFSHKHNHNDQQQQVNSSAQQTSVQQTNASNSKQEPVCSLRRNIENGQQNPRRLSNKSNSSTASTQNLIVSRRCRRSYRSQDDDFYMETDGSSCYSKSSSTGRDMSNGYGIRRPSVDTISTYLSHESNDIRYASNDYAGDDDVFLPQQQKINGSIVGVDADSDTISRFVHVVHQPEWLNCRPCVICLDELQQNPNNPAVSLIRCEHLMHLNCLNHLIITQSEQQQKQLPENSKTCATLYIECPVCGIVYGEKYGNQPSGTMSWSIIQKQLAGHEGQNTIQIVYK